VGLTKIAIKRYINMFLQIYTMVGKHFAAWNLK
jgi:hypothetical protein